MKKFILAILFTLFANVAIAQYTLIVPQGPGQGTSVWAEIVAKGLTKVLKEPVTVRHFPGARDLPGFNEFHNKLRFDNKTLMVSHGGNAVSYLLDNVDYNYADYDLVGLMNLNIVIGKHKSLSVKTDKIKVAAAAGYEPDGAAMAMLACGPMENGSIDLYLKCFKERIIWVNGLNGGERRLGFLRGEFNTTRESPSAWFKFYEGEKAGKHNELWFTHGVYNLSTKQQNYDPNFPNFLFEAEFERLWGVKPSGELYEVYTLTRRWRDVLQKAIWVNKGNPNTAVLRDALSKMLTDPEIAELVEKDTGKYQWIVGGSPEGNNVFGDLQTLVKRNTLNNAVKWNREAYNFPSIFKEQLVQ